MDAVLSKMDNLAIDNNDISALNAKMAKCRLKKSKKVCKLTRASVSSLNKQLANICFKPSKTTSYLMWEDIVSIVEEKKTIYVLDPPYCSIEKLHHLHDIFNMYKLELEDRKTLGFFAEKDGFATTGENFQKWLKVTPDLIKRINKIPNKDRVRSLLNCSDGLTLREMEVYLKIKQGTIRSIIKKMDDIKIKKINKTNMYFSTR